MFRYPDTSFLLSYYFTDANSARADVWRQRHPEPLFFAPLHRLEIRSALGQAVFRGRATAEEISAIWGTAMTDSSIGLLAQAHDPAHLFEHSADLAWRFAPETGARSLDTIHVAAALLLGAEEIVTFDLRQIALAERAGLRVAVL